MDEEIIGPREAARRLGVHENTIRNMAYDGRLTPVGAGAWLKFLAQDIDTFRQKLSAQRAAQLATRTRVKARALDEETRVIQRMCVLLDATDPDARRRIMAYLNDRFGES